MEKKIFNIDLTDSEQATENPNKPKLFWYSLLKEDYVFLHEFISKKVREGVISYNQKEGFLEGLKLLEEKNPNIKILENIPKRNYRGGKQKDAPELVGSTILLMPGQIKWIKSFLVERVTKDLSYSIPDFMHELVAELKTIK